MLKILYNDVAVGAKRAALENAYSAGENNLLNFSNYTLDDNWVYGKFQLIQLYSEGYTAVNPVILRSTGIDLTDNTEYFAKYDTPIGVMSSAVCSSQAPYAFDAPLTIRIKLSESYDTQGFNIEFLRNYCSKVNVSYYSVADSGAETLIRSTDFAPNSLNYNCIESTTVEGFNKVVITFLNGSAANMFAWIKSINFGNIVEITDIMSCSSSHQALLDGTDAPIGSLTFDCENTYNFVGQEGQSVDVYFNEKYQNRYYLSEIERTGEHRYSFQCDDVLSLLDSVTVKDALGGDTFDHDDSINPIFVGDKGTAVTGDTIAAQNSMPWGEAYIARIIDRISDFLGIEIEYYGDTNDDEGMKTYWRVEGYFDVTQTLRKFLVQCAVARGCYIILPEAGGIKFDQNFYYNLKGTFGAERILGTATVKKQTPVSEIEYKISRLGDWAENQELYSGESPGSTADTPETVIYDAPAIAQSISGGSFVDGFQPRYAAVFYCETAGTQIKIVGKKCNVFEKAYISKNSEAKKSNKKNFNDFSLVAGACKLGDLNYIRPNPQGETNQILARNNVKYVVTATVVLDKEKLMDYVAIETPYNGLLKGFITEINTNFGDSVKTAEVTISVL